jgi:hypothetical protein
MLNHCLFSIDPTLFTVYAALLFVSMCARSQIAVAESDTSFMAAFLSSISMIFVSEIGDKTFFIAGTTISLYHITGTPHILHVFGI